MIHKSNKRIFTFKIFIKKSLRKKYWGQYFSWGRDVVRNKYPQDTFSFILKISTTQEILKHQG